MTFTTGFVLSTALALGLITTAAATPVCVGSRCMEKCGQDTIVGGIDVGAVECT